jgi:glyoxylase I family protein
MPVGTKNSIINGCGAHHIAIQAHDWEESLRLYRDVLGMELAAEFGSPERKIVLLDMGDGSYIELFAPTPDTPPVIEPAIHLPVMHIALATTDAKAAAEHVRQAGYGITVEPKTVNLGKLTVTIAFFKGPNGEIIEFFQTH